MALVYIPKHLKYGLTVEVNGEFLTLTRDDGTPHPNPGGFILSMGGVSSFLSKCEEIAKPLPEYLSRLREEHRAERAERAREAAAWRVAQEERIKAEYNAIIESGDPIPVTFENVRKVLRYFRLINWGFWNLPQMSLPYKMHQYDCDGVPAVTIVFDEPVELVEGERWAAYSHGAPVGHLQGYKKIR